MRRLESSHLRDGAAVLLTADDVCDLAELCAADFRDTHAAVHRSGLYVGVGRDGAVALCRGPAWMEAGIWMAEPDRTATESLRGQVLTPDSLSLGLIR